MTGLKPGASEEGAASWRGQGVGPNPKAISCAPDKGFSVSPGNAKNDGKNIFRNCQMEWLFLNVKPQAFLKNKTYTELTEVTYLYPDILSYSKIKLP